MPLPPALARIILRAGVAAMAAFVWFLFYLAVVTFIGGTP